MFSTRVTPESLRKPGEVPLTFIPYYAWANRQATSMQVWTPLAGIVGKARSLGSDGISGKSEYLMTRSLVRWRIAVLVSAAIAISYLDRQTLPVAVSAIGKDIPLSNEQFSTLQSAFLFLLRIHVCGRRKADRRFWEHVRVSR